MSIDKLFKKAEKFFALDDETQKKKQDKREKLKGEFLKKIATLKKKIQASQKRDEKKELIKELKALNRLLDDFTSF